MFLKCRGAEGGDAQGRETGGGITKKPRAKFSGAQGQNASHKRGKKKRGNRAKKKKGTSSRRVGQKRGKRRPSVIGKKGKSGKKGGVKRKHNEKLAKEGGVLRGQKKTWRRRVACRKRGGFGLGGGGGGRGLFARKKGYVGKRKRIRKKGRGGLKRIA